MADKSITMCGNYVENTDSSAEFMSYIELYSELCYGLGRRACFTRFVPLCARARVYVCVVSREA
jgi:hypothetical protein